MVSGKSQDLPRHPETTNNFINDTLTVQYFAEQNFEKKTQEEPQIKYNKDGDIKIFIYTVIHCKIMYIL